MLVAHVKTETSDTDTVQRTVNTTCQANKVSGKPRGMTDWKSGWREGVQQQCYLVLSVCLQTVPTAKGKGETGVDRAELLGQMERSWA